MEAFAKQTSSSNKPTGFTLLEVMITGVLLMLFVILSSTVIHQGAQQLQKRQELLEIFNQMDAWTSEVKQAGFAAVSLSPGWHQKEIVDSRGSTYQLRWRVQELTPLLKGITFQLQHPLDQAILHEWKSGILFKP